MSYYVCRQDSYKVVRGAFVSPYAAAEIVMSYRNPAEYCTMSRWALEQVGAYKHGKAGNAQIQADLESELEGTA